MFLTHPRTGKEDPLMTLSVIVVLCTSVKFVLDGVTFTLYGHPISFGHPDPVAYAAFLTPVLGTHGYLNAKEKSQEVKDTEA